MPLQNTGVMRGFWLLRVLYLPPQGVKYGASVQTVLTGLTVEKGSTGGKKGSRIQEGGSEEGSSQEKSSGKEGSS